MKKKEDYYVDVDTETNNRWGIYDHTGKKIAVAFVKEEAEMLVTCYNLSSFLYR